MVPTVPKVPSVKKLFYHFLEAIGVDTYGEKPILLKTSKGDFLRSYGTEVDTFDE
jgi:hypothetical protein